MLTGTKSSYIFYSTENMPIFQTMPSQLPILNDAARQIEFLSKQASQPASQPLLINKGLLPPGRSRSGSRVSYFSGLSGTWTFCAPARDLSIPNLWLRSPSRTAAAILIIAEKTQFPPAAIPRIQHDRQSNDMAVL